MNIKLITAKASDSKGNELKILGTLNQLEGIEQRILYPSHLKMRSCDGIF